MNSQNTPAEGCFQPLVLGDELRILASTYRPRSRDEMFEKQRVAIKLLLERQAEGKHYSLPDYFVDTTFNHYYSGLENDLKTYFEDQKIRVILQKRSRYLESYWYVLHFDWSVGV